MDAERFKSQWQRLKLQLRRQFPQLDDGDIAAIDGDAGYLVDALVRRYGLARDEAEDAAQALLDDTAPASSRLAQTLGPGARKVREGLTEISAGLRELADEGVVHARDRAGALGERAREGADAARAQLDDLGDEARYWLKQTERFVRDRPFTALGIAAVAGWLLLGRR